jgi:hypothetical protein
VRPKVGHLAHLQDALDLGVDLYLDQILSRLTCGVDGPDVEPHLVCYSPERLDTSVEECPQENLPSDVLPHQCHRLLQDQLQLPPFTGLDLPTPGVSGAGASR